MARGFRGVRADLSELAHHLLDIACFFSPLVLSPNHADHAESPPPSPRPPSRVFAGILADFAEISGGLRSGLSRLSSAAAAFRDPPPAPALAAVDWDREPRESRAGGVSEDVLEFVMDLVECPESWLEFPVRLDNDFYMSPSQREHIATVECMVPRLRALRISLCPTQISEECFWKIYFALLHPRLNKHDMEHLSTQQIVDSMRIKLKETQRRVDAQSLSFGAESFHLTAGGTNNLLEDDQAHEASAITKTTSQQSICQWSEVPSDVGNTTDGERQSRIEDSSFREKGDCSIVLMESYMDELLDEGGQVHSPSSYELGQPIPGDDYHKAVHCTTQMNIPFDKESGGWHAVDDFDLDVVERSSVGKIM